MKLLVVCVSFLVLAAHGKVAPYNNEDKVYEMQPEIVAVEEDPVGVVGDVESQHVFAEEVPVERIFGAEEEPKVGSPQEPQWAYEVEDLVAEGNTQIPDTVHVPIISRACTNSACLYICNLLGFSNGVCVSVNTCQCSN